MTILGGNFGFPYAVPGEPGKSAYDIAVNLGYTGTVQQWLASLQGTGGGDSGGGTPASFSSITGAPTDNTNLAAALTGKQNSSAILTAITAPFTSAQETKLGGIATGATANSTDGNLRDRSTHTGSQTSSSISDFAANSRAQVEGTLVAGANITFTPAGTGATRTITVAAAAGGSSPSFASITGTPTDNTALATALAGKQNSGNFEIAVTAGTTLQYYRGDKSWGTLDKSAVGLPNVDNTADLAKPVSSVQTTALNLKANLASPAFSGTVSGITKAMVGLSLVDNTSDVSKPVSTAQANADNLRAALTGAAFTGAVSCSSTLTVQSLTLGRGNSALVTNTALGVQTLQNTTGGNNTAVGTSALTANTSGTSNTAVGTSSLASSTTGVGNVAIGFSALQSLTTGSGNTAINPIASSGVYAAVFNPTVESNRLCMGSTTVTNAYVQVAWTVVSDARDKTTIAPLVHGLDFVTKLNPVSYKFRVERGASATTGPMRYGFLAQEVLALEGASSVIVDAEDSNKLRINDTALIPVLVKALQELSAKFDAHVLSHS
jgi:hypothetical protein